MPPSLKYKRLFFNDMIAEHPNTIYVAMHQISQKDELSTPEKLTEFTDWLKRPDQQTGAPTRDIMKFMTDGYYTLTDATSRGADDKTGKDLELAYTVLPDDTPRHHHFTSPYNLRTEDYQGTAPYSNYGATGICYDYPVYLTEAYFWSYEQLEEALQSSGMSWPPGVTRWHTIGMVNQGLTSTTTLAPVAFGEIAERMSQTYQPLWAQRLSFYLDETKMNTVFGSVTGADTDAMEGHQYGQTMRVFLRSMKENIANATNFTHTAFEMALPMSDVEQSLINVGGIGHFASINSEYNYYSDIYEASLSGSFRVSGDTGVSGDRRKYDTPIALPNFSLGLVGQNTDLNALRESIHEMNTLRSLEVGGASTRETIMKHMEGTDVGTYLNEVWAHAYMTAIGTEVDAVAPSDIAPTSLYVDQRYGQPISPSRFENKVLKKTDIVFSHKHLSLLQDTENKIENHPFYVDIQFQSDTSTTLPDLFRDMGYMDKLMVYLANRRKPSTGTWKGYEESLGRYLTHGTHSKAPCHEAENKWNLKLTVNGESKVAGLGLGHEHGVVHTFNRRFYELDDFLDDLSNGRTDSYSTWPNTFSTADYIYSEGASCDAAKDKFYAHILKAKLTAYLEDNISPTFLSAETPELEKSDTLAYRIEKRIANPAGGVASAEPLQSIYLPNTSDTDIMRYIDTQVKNDTLYEYVVYAYQITPTLNYQYMSMRASCDGYDIKDGMTRKTFYYDFTAHLIGGDSTIWTDNINDYCNQYSGTTRTGDAALTEDQGYNTKVDLQMAMMPSLKIVETVIYKQSIRVKSSPPLTPEPFIAPYKGNQNSFHLVLQNRIGKEELKPISILEGDGDMFDTVAQAQRLLPGKLMRFEGDDRPSMFQIFRTTKQPTSWVDFKDALYYELEPSTLTQEQIQTGAIYRQDAYCYASALSETIDSNKKYYYMFRTVDVKGLISNPSEIYEVELVNNDGSTYLLVRVVPFAPKVPKKKHRKFRRYLKISPTITQSMIDTQEYESAWDAVGNGMSLGVDDVTIWGKHFKFVVKSMKTGREAHIQVNFTKSHNMTEREVAGE